MPGQSNALSQDMTHYISVTAEPILIKLETKNYHSKVTHHVKLYVDAITCVVWTNTQFAAVWVFCLFWFLNHAHRSHQWKDFDDRYIIRRIPTQGYVFWGFR